MLIVRRQQGKTNKEKITECGQNSVVDRELSVVKQHPAGWQPDPFNSFTVPLDKYINEGLEYCEYIALTFAMGLAGLRVAGKILVLLVALYTFAFPGWGFPLSLR